MYKQIHSGTESKRVVTVVVEIAAYRMYDLQKLFSRLICVLSAFTFKAIYRNRPTSPNAVNIIE